MAASKSAAEAEFNQLRQQKADDWRFITQLNLSMLATTAGIFTAGLTSDTVEACALAPIPFFLGVVHMIGQAGLHARLQAFLAEKAPSGSLDYEGRLAAVKAQNRKDLVSPPGMIGWQLKATSFWILVATVVGLISVLFPWMSDMKGECTVWTVGGVIAVMGFAGFCVRLDRDLEGRAEWWRERWRQV